MLGNGRLEAMCFDGVKRLCHIRGKLRKKVWINQGDIILIGLRDYQDAKADVILKYTFLNSFNHNVPSKFHYFTITSLRIRKIIIFASTSQTLWNR